MGFLLWIFGAFAVAAWLFARVLAPRKGRKDWKPEVRAFTVGCAQAGLCLYALLLCGMTSVILHEGTLELRAMDGYLALFAMILGLPWSMMPPMNGAREGLTGPITAGEIAFCFTPAINAAIVLALAWWLGRFRRRAR